MRSRWLACGVGGAILAAVLAIAATGDDGAGSHSRAAEPRGPSPAGPTPETTIGGGPLYGYNAAAASVVNPSTKTGGTLRLLSTQDCDSWDPGRTRLGWCANLQRLVNRTLVGYTKVDGTEFELGPDLATSLGRHNTRYTEWTYTLQPGLRYADGTPIRPIDVKYGIERLFARRGPLDGRPLTYLLDAIPHPRSYRGPQESGDLNSISTTNDSITFELARANPDFDYLMALPGSAPVPYAGHPVASGPYMVGSDRPNRRVVLVRNPRWAQRTDVIRHPLVATVRLRIDRNANDIDRQLLAGRADACADCEVRPRTGRRILTSPDLKDHADDPLIGGSTQYLAVLPSVIPNVHCRRAIFYAFDKAAAARVFGAPTGAVPAESLTPPGIAGFDSSFDPYPSGPGLTGDLARARAELRACGKPNGFTTRFVYATPSETGPYLYRVEQKALRRVGVTYTVGNSNSTYYCSTAGDSPSLLRRQGIGLVSSTWSDAVPTGYGFYSTLLDRFDCKDFDADLRRLHSPIVDRVLAAAALGGATDADWRALNRAVMRSATYLPVAYEKALYYRNPRMTNVTCDNALAAGIYDFVNVGVR